jgi:hypothetical protein
MSKLPTIKKLLKEATDDIENRPKWAGGGKQGWGMAKPAPGKVKPQPTSLTDLNGEELIALSNMIASTLEDTPDSPNWFMGGSMSEKDHNALEIAQNKISSVLGITADTDADPTQRMPLSRFDAHDVRVMLGALSNEDEKKHLSASERKLVEKIFAKLYSYHDKQKRGNSY